MDVQILQLAIMMTDDDDSCTYPAETYLDCDSECLNDSDGDGVCDELVIEGVKMKQHVILIL